MAEISFPLQSKLVAPCPVGHLSLQGVPTLWALHLHSGCTRPHSGPGLAQFLRFHPRQALLKAPGGFWHLPLAGMAQGGVRLLWDALPWQTPLCVQAVWEAELSSPSPWHLPQASSSTQAQANLATWCLLNVHLIEIYRGTSNSNWLSKSDYLWRFSSYTGD